MEKITREQALAKIEELKKFVGESDVKKEEKVLGITIKNRFTDSIIFQSTKTTFKEAVIERLQSDADLSGADLGDANLRGANLSGANLSGAEMQNVKFIGKISSPEILTKKQLPDFLNALGFKLED